MIEHSIEVQIPFLQYIFNTNFSFSLESYIRLPRFSSGSFHNSGSICMRNYIRKFRKKGFWNPDTYAKQVSFQWDPHCIRRGNYKHPGSKYHSCRFLPRRSHSGLPLSNSTSRRLCIVSCHHFFHINWLPYIFNCITAIYTLFAFIVNLIIYTIII